MAQLEDTALAAAARMHTAERRGQRQRVAWLAASSASYAVDVVFLILFALAGTLPAAVPLAYCLGAAAVCAFFFALTASGRNLSLREPGMVLPQNLCGIALQFVVLFMAPQIAFPWLSNLMTVLTFSMVWLSFAGALVVWTVCTALTAVLFFTGARDLGMPLSSTPEVALVWAYFSLVLGRCIFLNIHSTTMRKRLEESRRKLSAAMAQVQELVSHDELTKALNRRSLLTRLGQEKSSAERTGLPFSVALFDLDDFKVINDSHGHAAGDEVLKAFVRIVHATMRDTDIFGRYGGEEFLMICADTGLGGACTAIERVRKAVAGTDWARFAPGRTVSASIGVAAWNPGEEIAQLLKRADDALYQAKRNGRNRVETA